MSLELDDHDLPSLPFSYSYQHQFTVLLINCFLALTMAPDVSRNVRPSIVSCILVVLFVVKLLKITFSVLCERHSNNFIASKK